MRDIIDTFLGFVNASTPGVTTMSVDSFGFEGTLFALIHDTEGIFAVTAEQIAEYMESPPDPFDYQHFCASTVVCTDTDLAAAVYRATEMLICYPGDCSPVLVPSMVEAIDEEN